MKPVVIESPFAGCVSLNKAYLQACIRDCLRRGETPYASHQQLTDALDDTVHDEREFGMSAGWHMRDFICQHGGCSVYYVDLFWSSGMSRARGSAEHVVQRTIDDPDEWKRILTEARKDPFFNECAEFVIAEATGGTKCYSATAVRIRARYLVLQRGLSNA